jgi:hypothetical protein
MTLKGLGGDPPLSKRMFQVCSSMKTLTTGRDLKPAKQQIEAGCCRLRSRMRVERPCGERKPEDKQRGNPILHFRKPAEPTLCFRIQVVGQIRSSQAFQAFTKGPGRHIEHRGQCCAMFLVQLLEDVRQQLAFKLYDIFRAIYETHFEIERVILRQVTARGVRFRTVDMTGFKDTLQSGNSVLLVELGALSQVRQRDRSI